MDQTTHNIAVAALIISLANLAHTVFMSWQGARLSRSEKKTQAFFALIEMARRLSSLRDRTAIAIDVANLVGEPLPPALSRFDQFDAGLKEFKDSLAELERADFLNDSADLDALRIKAEFVKQIGAEYELGIAAFESIVSERHNLRSKLLRKA